jgi:hypothetical protein
MMGINEKHLPKFLHIHWLFSGGKKKYINNANIPEDGC